MLDLILSVILSPCIHACALSGWQAIAMQLCKQQITAYGSALWQKSQMLAAEGSSWTVITSPGFRSKSFMRVASLTGTPFTSSAQPLLHYLQRYIHINCWHVAGAKVQSQRWQRAPKGLLCVRLYSW